MSDGEEGLIWRLGYGEEGDEEEGVMGRKEYWVSRGMGRGDAEEE